MPDGLLRPQTLDQPARHRGLGRDLACALERKQAHAIARLAAGLGSWAKTSK